MASIVAKRPVVGVAAGVIFAALGLLLISVERGPQGTAGVLSGLYTVAGYFILLVAFLSIAAGTAGIWSEYRSRCCRAAVLKNDLTKGGQVGPRRELKSGEKEKA
jgi:hypothetical protein